MSGPNGWIKLWRKTQNSDMYQALNSKQRDVMINILMLANHEERTWEWNGELHTCKPGQFKTSLSSLKKVCADDVSIQNIRTAIDKLEKWDFLTNKSTKSGRIITVVHWGNYQSNGDKANKDSNKEVTKNQQRGNKELTTNKNDKEVKEVKETTNGGKFEIEKKDNGNYDYPDEFEKIWENYPYRRGTKKATWRKWKSLRENGIENDRLLKSVKNYKKQVKSKGTDEQYVKHGQTFFGQDEHWREYLSGKFETASKDPGPRDYYKPTKDDLMAIHDMTEEEAEQEIKEWEKKHGN